MTVAPVVPGAPVRASVKWYDADSGCGFLVAEDGPDGIFCHASALEAVGLARLVAGAVVTCEVAPGRHGPQVLRILGVDFRPALPAPLSADEATGAGQGAPGPGAVPPGRRVRPGLRVRALVKWFLPQKGYGFLEREDGSGDLFCHMGPVAAAGLETLPQGALVSCEVAQGDRGPQVSRILGVDPPAGPAGAQERRPGAAPLRPRETPPPAAGPERQGTVKFYDPARGFGFILPDDDGRDIFVHYGALSGAGLETLEDGERVSFRVEETQRGPQARDVGLL